MINKSRAIHRPTSLNSKKCCARKALAKCMKKSAAFLICVWLVSFGFVIGEPQPDKADLIYSKNEGKCLMLFVIFWFSST